MGTQRLEGRGRRFIRQRKGAAQGAAREPVRVRRARLRGCSGRVYLDGEGVVRQFDARFAEMLGFAPGGLEGAFFFSYVHARDLSPVLRSAAALLQHRLTADAWTIRFQSAAGDWFRLAVRAEPTGPPGDGLVLVLDV